MTYVVATDKGDGRILEARGAAAPHTQRMLEDELWAKFPAANIMVVSEEWARNMGAIPPSGGESAA